MRLAITTLLIVIGGLSTSVAQQRSHSAMIDVSLTEQGNLVSRCQYPAGQNQTIQSAGRVIVELSQKQQLVATATTRDDGWFLLPNVAPGVYQLRSKDWSHSIRVWTRNAAPPAARDPIVILLGPEQPLPSVAAFDARSETPREATIASEAEPPSDDAVVEEVAAVEEPILQLRYDEGAMQKSDPPHADMTVANATPPTDVETSTGSFTNQTQESDVTFDPFAAAIPDSIQSPPLAPQFAPDTAQDPEAPSNDFDNSVPDQSTATMEPAPVGQLQPVGGRYIPGSVGPTVGDVVLTSVGIAGITLGSIGIYKYDHRRNLRYIVSP